MTAARRRDWMNPWTNPLGEILATVIGKLPLGRDDRDDTDDWDHHQPFPAWSGLRFCKTCNTGTLHVEFFWALDNESTLECQKCGALWFA